MNYELAKRLRDAGFKKIFFSTAVVDGKEFMYDERLPTLQELIDECGDDVVLRHVRIRNRWECGLLQEEMGHLAYGGLIFGLGETPIEAVANYYLKHNTPHEND